MNNQSESPYFRFEIWDDKDTQLKLSNFRQLPLGWHYGEGGPISDAVVNRACYLNQFAKSAGIYAADAFPGVDGSISLTFYVGDDFYELILRPEGAITFAHDRGDQEIDYRESIPLEEAIALIKQFNFSSWKTTYESFIRSTMTQEKNDSTVLPFQEAMVFQSSVKNVSPSPAWKYVSISELTMQTRVSLATRRSSGSSLANNSLKDMYLSKKLPQAVMSVTAISETYRTEMPAV